MNYALAKFSVYMLGDRPFIVYTKHASLLKSINIPHFVQRMASRLSFFTEYNFSVEVDYNPGRLKVVADVLFAGRIRTGCATRWRYNYCCRVDLKCSFFNLYGSIRKE